ncbi:hypothetical protein CXZ05_06430 [Arthrobacter sp. AFG20]|nr:hypothetical protein CXZ05_06430 [Arthrobacter sp. AFG20]
MIRRCRPIPEAGRAEQERQPASRRVRTVPCGHPLRLHRHRLNPDAGRRPERAPRPPSYSSLGRTAAGRGPTAGPLPAVR